MLGQHATYLWASLVALAASPASLVDGRTVQTSLATRQPLPAVFPPPQQISAAGCAVKLNDAVTIITGNTTDKATIDEIKAVVSASGGKATVATKSHGKGAQIIVGTGTDNAAAAAAAKALTGKSADGLADDGYVLASGKYQKQPTVVLNGVDARGTFYAVQTLRQLVDDRRGVPGVSVRDWPLMPIRGSIEGFYGVPWSDQARLDQQVFYGKHKMNTYIYTPKGDSKLRAKWREPYTADELKVLQKLVDTANANHVDFTWALSPGLDICYSSEDDFNTTLTKFDQVRNLGVHSFYVALDDIPIQFHCDSDKAKWPGTGSNETDNFPMFADAHAYYLNRIQKEYVEAHGLADLQTVPTNYAGSKPDAYKSEFGKQLDKKIRVQWTGEGVFSPNVTAESVQTADKTYVTDNLYIWDNFPVNDGMTSRLFLNTLTGRAPDLYKYLIGFTSNPMVQSYASMFALASYGDYTWNGPAYNADDSIAAVQRELAGKGKDVLKALLAFADLNQNWPYREPEIYAPELSKDVAAFWAARKAKSAGGAKPLKDRLALINKITDTLGGMAMKPFGKEVAPWSNVAMQWATACQHLITMLDAIDKGDKSKADAEYKTAQEWVQKTKAKTVSSLNDTGEVVPNSIVPTTGDGVFDTFVANATTIYKGQ